MNRKRKYKLLSLVVLFVVLLVTMTLTEEMDLTVRMIACGVICGFFGVSQKIINDKIE